MPSTNNKNETLDRMRKSVSDPESQRRMKELQDWFRNEKPKIDRRADKYKK